VFNGEIERKPPFPRSHELHWLYNTNIYISFFNDIVSIQNHKTRRISLYIIFPIDNITVYFIFIFINLIWVNKLATRPLFYSISIIFIDLRFLYEFIGR